MCRLVTWECGNITTMGRGLLVKAVLTSQVVYHATSFIILPRTMNNITKLRLRGLSFGL